VRSCERLNVERHCRGQEAHLHVHLKKKTFTFVLRPENDLLSLDWWKRLRALTAISQQANRHQPSCTQLQKEDKKKKKTNSKQTQTTTQKTKNQTCATCTSSRRMNRCPSSQPEDLNINFRHFQDGMRRRRNATGTLKDKLSDKTDKFDKISIKYSKSQM
jgi:hypothetical protein